MARKTIEFSKWSGCATPGCINKACVSLDSKFCFPCTPGNEHVKEMKIKAHRTDFSHGTFIVDDRED